MIKKYGGRGCTNCKQGTKKEESKKGPREKWGVPIA
jgi:hypothetical protein